MEAGHETFTFGRFFPLDSESRKPSRQRVASLDGLRAFSLLTVLSIHIQQRTALLSIPLPLADGVAMFFSLSGFLIGAMLLREWSATGSVRVGRFYARRAARLLPPLFVYLAAAAALCAQGRRPVPWRDLGGAGLLLTGWLPGEASPFTQHLWSLAVEAHFYLLAPLLLLASLRLGGRRAAVLLSSALVALSPAVRMLAAWAHLPLLEHRQSVLLPGRLDSLFAGVLLALAFGTPAWERLWRRWGRFAWLAPVFLALISPALRIRFGNAYTFTAGYTLEALAGAATIGWLLHAPESLLSRVLGWRPLAFFGAASYSAYLYQSPIIHFWPAGAGGSHPLLLLLLSMAVGLAAYGLVEVPVEALRQRGVLRMRWRRQLNARLGEGAAL